MQTVTLKKLLSKQNIEKLESALDKMNMEQLRKQMEKLFTFKNIYTMHDSHLTELAECIVDLANDDDRQKYARETEKYARAALSRYHDGRRQAEYDVQWAQAAGNVSTMEMLDRVYARWVYDEGFEYSRYQMYTMMCSILREVLEGGE